MNSTFSVSRLGIADLAIAQQLAASLHDAGDVPDARMRELLEDSRCIVLAALNAAEPVGYLVAYHFPSLSGERLSYLYDIEVAVPFRRRGVGRLLVDSLLAICRSAGVSSIWVGSSLTNTAACALWDAAGAARESDQFVEYTFDLD